jgi:hypothetical protein
MQRGNPYRLGWLLLPVVLLLAASTATAQVARGNIYGKVVDPQGAVLPGASVTLSGVFGVRSTITDELGQFRFLNVDQGTQTLSVEMSGFATQKRDVIVRTGDNINLAFTLSVAGVQETVMVTAETPMIDTKKVGTSTVITRDELERVPSSRDPWALMRTIPGVLVDRVNIAGSESGQQSYFTTKGSDPKDAVWSLDGVVITDMAALGSSPVYFNYDAFDEVDFTTGGSNVSQSTAALGINIVPKRGTNVYHGGVTGYFTHDDLQWGNIPPELVGDPRLQGSNKADHTDQIFDWTANLGGPVVKDKLWFFGSYSENDIRVRNLSQARDKTRLLNYSAKVNWQATRNDMVSFLWFLGAKEKSGRSGSEPGFTQETGTLWDQGGYYPSEPHGLSKLEWSHTFGANFFLSAKGAYYSTGFSLEPQGGLDTNLWVRDAVNREAIGTAYGQFQKRPQHTLQADGTWFTSGMGGSHEIRFGAGYRDTAQIYDRINPGDKVQARFNATSTRARFYRDAATDQFSDYWSAYVSDTFTKNRLTIDVGLRWDTQRAKNRASSVEGNPLIPDLLPTLSYAGDSSWPITWNSLSPRVGFTYALDDARKTLVRGSYAWYAGQLQTTAAATNPVATSYLEYDWRDLNGDQIVQLNEVDLSHLRASGNVDPLNPGAVGQSPNRIDPKLKPNRTQEVVVGLDRELATNLVASVAYTWQKTNDLLGMQTTLAYWYPWVGITSADYSQGERVCANGYCATPWVLNDAALERPDVTGGLYITNRKDYSWTYNGIEASLNKRLSNNWMGRVSFAWNDVVENVGPGAVTLPGPTAQDPKQNGGAVAQYGAGTSGKTYFFNAKWQLSANALYQLPKGFEVSASLFGRQGYPNPVYLSLDAGALDGIQYFLAEGTKVDTQRFPDLWDLDLRLAKNIKLGRANMVLSAEMFNVFNSNTEMNRVNDANSSAYQRLDEIMAPRIIRFGARVTF